MTRRFAITDRAHLHKRIQDGIALLLDVEEACETLQSNTSLAPRSGHCRGRGRRLRGGADVGNRTCSVGSCDRSAAARGWCKTHYARWRDTGDVRASEPIRAIIPDTVERFWSKYGTFRLDGRSIYAHRFAWTLVVGPIAEGMTLDHLCRVRNCVRAPDHLAEVTLQENMRRGMSLAAINGRKTHCRHGHRFSESNTHIDRAGQRHCRACDARRHRERRANR